MATVGYFEGNEDHEMFIVVRKSTFDTNGVDDTDDVNDIIPEGFYALAETAYEHDFPSYEDAMNALIAAGFEEKKLT